MLKRKPRTKILAEPAPTLTSYAFQPKKMFEMATLKSDALDALNPCANRKILPKYAVLAATILSMRIAHGGSFFHLCIGHAHKRLNAKGDRQIICIEAILSSSTL